MADIGDLERALERYDEALLVKGKGKESLLSLDKWYRLELPRAVEERRGTDDGPHLTHDEMVKLIQWKLSRGKFRPSLEKYVRGNADELVRQSTHDALSTLLDLRDKHPKAKAIEISDTSVIRTAMDHACQMKGVGPALSSALLSLALPHTLPYMSDEMMLWGAGIVKPAKYTPAEYLSMLSKAQERIKQARTAKNNKDLQCLQSIQSFEQACWAYGTLKAHEKWESTETGTKRTKVEDDEQGSSSNNRKKASKRKKT